jgi:type I restriction enzyme S subunit
LDLDYTKIKSGVPDGWDRKRLGSLIETNSSSIKKGFVVITPNTAPSSFVYCATTTDNFVAYLMNRAKGAAYPAVKPSDFKDAQLSVPPGEILDAFDTIAAPVFEDRHVLQKQNTLLAEAGDHLLARLMHGEIEV